MTINRQRLNAYWQAYLEMLSAGSPVRQKTYAAEQFANSPGDGGWIEVDAQFAYDEGEGLWAILGNL